MATAEAGMEIVRDIARNRVGYSVANQGNEDGGAGKKTGKAENVGVVKEQGQRESRTLNALGPLADTVKNLG